MKYISYSKYIIYFLCLALLVMLSGCAGISPNIPVPQNLVATEKLTVAPNVVLVLGAGGVRGYAHLGVIKVLHDAGVPIDMVVGASAGSVIGALYADSLDPAKITNIMNHAGFWDFADIANRPGLGGIIEGYHVERFLLNNMVARNFNQLKIPLVVVTTDITTGDTFAIGSGPIPPAILASGAIPGLVEPPNLYGRVLIDGGVSDPLPVDIAKRYHPKIIIAVNINQKLPQETPRTAYNIYSRSYQIIWEKLCQRSEEGADVVIRPNVGMIGTFDFNQKQAMYQAGIIAAKKALPQILLLLKEKHIKTL